MCGLAGWLVGGGDTHKWSRIYHVQGDNNNCPVLEVVNLGIESTNPLETEPKLP